MTPKKIIALIILALLTSSLSQAADKVIKSREGNCQISVPADWSVSAIPGFANSPDKQMSVAMSSPKMMDSFSELKKTAQSVYKDDKVTKDSATEFEMEGQSQNGKPNVYRGIPAGGTIFCIVDVTYAGGKPDVARSIARTLKPGK